MLMETVLLMLLILRPLIPMEMALTMNMILVMKTITQIVMVMGTRIGRKLKIWPEQEDLIL